MVEGKGGISAKVIADSVANGIRLTTLQLRYHRFIHSEFMTHRMFSRNASSSRAIPVQKMIDQVLKDPATPIHWGANKPGMQAGEEVDLIPVASATWRGLSFHTIRTAKDLIDQKLHKQIVNRLLEPFQFINVIVTATEWDNFFKQRLHPAAQPEIQELARVMKEVMESSEPREMPLGEFHLPYVSEKEIDEYMNYDAMIKASVARCARVSYLNHDNSKPDVMKDCELYDRLLSEGHMSPFEHIATPMMFHWQKSRGHLMTDIAELPDGVTHIDRNYNLWSANFRGWKQYRQMIMEVE